MREEPKRLSYDDVDLLDGREILLHLREYLIAYRVFASGTTSTRVDRGQHNPCKFNVGLGLCFNLQKYTSCVTDSFGASSRLEMLLESTLDAQFDLWFIDNPQTGDLDADFAYPFGEDDFYIRYAARNQHECPKRLAFLDSAIAALLV